MINYILNSRPLLVFIIPFSIGCLSVVSFQPFNFTFINFIIFPCLFLILSNINKRSKNTYRTKPYLINLFFVGYFFGIGFFLTGTYWISNSLKFDDTFKSLVPFTIIAIPIFLGLFYGLASLISGKYLKNDLNSIFLFSATFSLLDYVRAKIFTGFPWNFWSYSWSWFIEVIQILNPIGLFAFNLLSITFFLIPSIIFFKNDTSRNLILISFISLFFLNYLYGNYIINKNDLNEQNLLDKKEFINIKIISPNFDLKYNLTEDEVLLRLKELIKYSEIDKNKKTLFVWPEGSISGKYFFEIEKYKKVISDNFFNNHKIILGSNTLNENGNKFFNSFLIVDHKLNKDFQYNKIKLVPFGEFLPNSLFLEKIGLKKITEGFGSFSEGKEQISYLYENIKLNPLICYEIIFPELTQNITGKKNLIINISEDGWFGDSIGPYQHFSKAIFRAVESNTFVIRSANKGISAVINNKGKVIKSLKSNESGNIESRVPILEIKSRNKNDLIFLILLFTYVLIFLNFKKNEK